jgi:hypothetical protein
MAYVGYPSGSMQAPQSGLPGGALTTGPLTAGLGAPGTATSGQDPRFFQDLINKLRGSAGAVGNVAKYGAAVAPGVSNIAGGIASGDVGQAVTGGAQVAAGAAATRAAAPIGAAVTRGAAAMLPGPTKLAAPLIGGATQALAGTAAAGGVGMLAQIPGAIASAVTGQQERTREEGKTPGVIPGTGTGVGLDATSKKELEMIRYMLDAGVQSNVAGAQAMLPVANQYLDRQMQRQMQMNQQLGQLTGALNRQQYAFQLAGGAQEQAGANLRTMMTSNPYAASTFRY